MTCQEKGAAHRSVAQLAGSLPLMDATGPLTETLARLYDDKSSVRKKAESLPFFAYTARTSLFDGAFVGIDDAPPISPFLSSELFDMQSTNSVVLAHHLELPTCSSYDFKVRNLSC